tara:strand:+ start:1290 stop:1754 length:465 start_codon:yes stop_codon:yes gene_type:complete
MAKGKISTKGKVAIVVAILLVGTMAYFIYKKSRKVEKPKAKEKEVLKKAFDNLTFEINKSVIKSSSFDALNDLATYLIETQKPLKIIGHTDSVGSEASNWQLSTNRANAVKKYLLDKGVISKISALGKGEKRPIATNDTAEGRSKNRRVEFILE